LHAVPLNDSIFERVADLIAEPSENIPPFSEYVFSIWQIWIINSGFGVFVQERKIGPQRRQLSQNIIPKQEAGICFRL
jgi:hypothetical protein